MNIELEHVNSITLDQTPLERQLAVFLARQTVNWGRIECAFYLVMEAVDADQSGKWMKVFLSTPVTDARIQVVQKQVEEVIANSAYPETRDNLRECIASFKSIRERRNLLAHGLWIRSPECGDAEFDVLPLRLEKRTKAVLPMQRVNINYCLALQSDMEHLTQKVVILVAEMMAMQSLSKQDKAEARRAAQAEAAKSRRSRRR